MQGEWLGSWPGEWFGDGVERPPGSISGTATVSITAVGVLVAPTGFMSGSASLAVSAVGSMAQESSGGALIGLRESIRRDVENSRKQREAAQQAEQIRQAEQEGQIAEIEASAAIAELRRMEADELQAARSKQMADAVISNAMQSAADAERVSKGNRNRAAMLAALMLLQ